MLLTAAMLTFSSSFAGSFCYLHCSNCIAQNFKNNCTALSQSDLRGIFHEYTYCIGNYLGREILMKNRTRVWLYYNYLANSLIIREQTRDEKLDLQ